jgi:hypothetical protein
MFAHVRVIPTTAAVSRSIILAQSFAPEIPCDSIERAEHKPPDGPPHNGQTQNTICHSSLLARSRLKELVDAHEDSIARHQAFVDRITPAARNIHAY